MYQNLQSDQLQLQTSCIEKGSSGAEITTYNTVASFGGRVIAATSNWLILYAQRKIEISHQVFTTSSISIVVGDQILWSNRVLRVIGIRSWGQSYNRSNQYDCLEITI